MNPTLTDLRADPATVEAIVTRAGREDYHRWADQVRSCGYCSRPVRLRGTITRTAADGHRTTYTTDTEPDRTLLVRCGNRRASVCPSCSFEYAGDMWQLLYAGAAGGRKGVPDSIRSHPLVFATLTAPGFGAVHTTRTDRPGGRGRCRPPRGKPTLCGHGRPTWCTAVHGETDERLGQPLCGDCYDYPAHVAFNWHAPELWRRFTITLRRVLAHRAGLTSTEFRQRARVSFVKVAEYQRRAVVHFHALVRLDAPGDTFEPCDLPLDAVDLADAIHKAAGLVRLVVNLPECLASTTPSPQQVRQDPARPKEQRQLNVELPLRDAKYETRQNPHHRSRDHSTDCTADLVGRLVDPLTPAGTRVPAPAPTPGTHESSMSSVTRLVLRFGTQTDTQPINGGPAGDLTPERVAAYIAKYATKSADDFGVGDRRISLDALPLLGLSPHVTRIAETCWNLGEHEPYDGLRRWLHMLGFRGHFATKSRRYSTTLGALRAARRTYARQHATGDLLEITDEETTLVVARWQYAGTGYLTTGDAALALSAAARARERRQAARDAAD